MDMDECFYRNGAKEDPLNIPGNGRFLEADAEACQKRCADTPGCAHFSFWDDGGCHLADEHAHFVKQRLGSVVGPARWPSYCASAPFLVRYLVTFGAPAVSYPPLANPGGRCIPGLRIYTENDRGGKPGKDSDAAAMTTNFPHAKTPVLVLRGEGDSPSIFVDCPGETRWPIFGWNTFHNWIIHSMSKYEERFKTLNVPGVPMSEMGIQLVSNFLKFPGFAYDQKLETIRGDVQEVPGWNLVGYMEHFGFRSDVDRVLVIQEEATKDCGIVFQGSQGVEDLAGFLDDHGTGFCGFGNAHTGVRNELWRITADEKWKTYIRPKLEKCAAVDCVGHSLGGALCNLFTACANSGRWNDPDFLQLAWQPAKSPELLHEVA